MSDVEDTLMLLQRFLRAWNARDVDALMTCMHDQCEFTGASGATCRGGPAVRQGYERLFATYPHAAWHDDTHFVTGDRAVSTWRFSGTTADGTQVDVRGCDLFVIRAGRIACKDSYRKSDP